MVPQGHLIRSPAGLSHHLSFGFIIAIFMAALVVGVIILLVQIRHFASANGQRETGAPPAIELFFLMDPVSSGTALIM
jgi:hypothetical protein